MLFKIDFYRGIMISIRTKKNKKNKKGFTLIELLIVVAIIAILAAIAIPQFTQYRIKVYNSSANSDIRNAKTVEEALYADFQAYGDTDNSPGCNGGICTGPPVIISTTDSAGNSRSLSVGTSNNVQLLAKTNAGGGAAGVNYLVFTKHKKGNSLFMADGNSAALYWLPATADADMVDPGYPSTPGNDISGSGAFPL
jgi:prepilin-type N-terminal cleavage/methylation domain-containing protein